MLSPKELFFIFNKNVQHDSTTCKNFVTAHDPAQITHLPLYSFCTFGPMSEFQKHFPLHKYCPLEAITLYCQLKPFS